MTAIPSLLFAWRFDALSTVLAVPALVLVIVAGAYAWSYLDQPQYREESRLRFWLLYALFGAGMLATLGARDLLQFLISWEVMTVASYVLVAYEMHDASVLRAAFKYFVMTHVATACLLLAVLLLWAEGGSLWFDAVPATFTRLAADRPVLLHSLLGLMFVGFATKAGLWPFGDWLPDAHPAAPAPVSAVLSGVMVKVGLYGFLRFFLWALAPAAPEVAVAWGYVLVAAGVLSALVGGFAACASTDTKVLLAYSTIAQSGLISVAIGAGLVLLPTHPVLAQLALLAALFHAVSDAAVKGLLFFVAGSVQFRTGSRRLEDLGGLFNAMPVSGWTALVASLAIAGFPPLTAFIGKWLMLQSTVLSGTPLLIAAGLAVLLASVLSILYAVKFFSAAFLTRPMRPERLEVPAAMQGAQVTLALAVLVLALMPGYWLRLLGSALADIPALAAAPGPEAGLLGVASASGAVLPAILVVGAIWTCMLAFAALGPARPPRKVETWMGGAIVAGEPSPVVSLGFFVPLREMMHAVYRPMRWPNLPSPTWVLPTLDADHWLFQPAAAQARRFGEALGRLHTGAPHRYIVWQLIGTLLLLLLPILTSR
jgi:formate hydrogenlyase subunit 3/multisubunit Na+/H+ antiporter MnhD subunit